MPRVLVTPPMLFDTPGPYRDVLEGAGFEVVYSEQGLSLKEPANLISQLDGIDAVLCSVEPYTREILEATRLRVVARNGVGFDSVDVAAATELGLLVTNTPGANSRGVAEHALALMLGVVHGYPARLTESRSGTWQRTVLPGLREMTVGIVGLGAIGRALVPLLDAIGSKVMAYDPFPDAEFAKQHGVDLCSFEQLLAAADVVSLHLPCTEETADLFDARTFASMRPGSILINTARGGLVDEDALVAALESGQIRAAGLDVFKTEPLPADHPLAKSDSVLPCPHMGGIDAESLSTMARLAAESVVELHAGRVPEGRVVNDDILGGWKW